MAATRFIVLFFAMEASGFELNYGAIAVTAPRRVVTDADVQAKFEEVDKPYVLVAANQPAALGRCVFCDVSLSAPGFEWARANYLVELLDDQAEPFGRISSELAERAVEDGDACAFDFLVDLDLRSGLSPEFEGLEKDATCACSVLVKKVLDKRPDTRSDDEKRALIAEKLRARAQIDADELANGAIRAFVRRETGEDWAHLSTSIADREAIDLADVPKFLRDRAQITWLEDAAETEAEAEAPASSKAEAEAEADGPRSPGVRP